MRGHNGGKDICGRGRGRDRPRIRKGKYINSVMNHRKGKMS